MAARKLPRIYRMDVVPYRPGRRAVLLAVLAMLFVAAAIGGYLAGRHLTLLAVGGDGVDAGGAARLEALLDENAAMRDELAVYRGGGDVAREVEVQVRNENLGLQARIDELEQAVAWYRRVAFPDRGGKGLLIEQLALTEGAGGVWRLQFVLVRTGDTDGAVDGRIEGKVVAQGAAGRVEFPLSQLLAPEGQQFRVRYVEERKPELRLPAGLTPVRVDVVAVLTAPHGDRVEKSWRRQVTTRQQEVSGDAGQGQR